ncbi:MAG: B12-binding domain-containing radical SAM protein [Methanobrevibacter sp.]|jgi:radical SAM superfamily enzyme YgiQ (UPF0313 family)|nr:B12-binding domain-containing radical SAM protein [Candidatus Methanovirga australis]
MKIAIVNTNKISPFKHDVHFGIAYIIQYANLHSEKVDYLDLNIVNWNKFGKIIEDYDLVGYSILSHDYYDAIKAISINRKVNSDVTIVVGGIDPSTDSDKYMKNLDIDHVVTGEGEISFFEIIQAKKENKKLEKLILGERIENLDELNFINRDIFPKEETLDPYFSKPTFGILVGRVCLYNCKFCQPAPKIMFGTKLRVRSPEHVVKELIYLKGKYGLESYQIYDDNILQNRNWIIKFIECCKSTNFKAKFMIRGRSDNIIRHKNLIGELYEIGLREVFVGFESGSDKMLKLFNKKLLVEQNEEASKILNKMQIRIVGSFMFGFPQETKYDMKLTEEFVKNSEIDYLIFNSFIPFPGAYLSKEYKEKGLLYNPENVDVSLYKPKIKGINYYRVVWMIFKLNFKYQFKNQIQFKYKFNQLLTLIYHFLGITLFYIQYFFKNMI